MNENAMDDTNSVQEIEKLSPSEVYNGRIDRNKFRKVVEYTRRGKRGVLLYRLDNGDEQRRMEARDGRIDKVYFGVEPKKGQDKEGDKKQDNDG